MMDVCAVMVSDGNGHRWIDSLWILRDGADDRVELLMRTFGHMIPVVNNLKAWIAILKLEDGALAAGTTETAGATSEANV